jgi:hypothetical protein
VTSLGDREMLRAEARYYRDRVALLRAKLYRWGSGPTARLQQLERSLELAEQRLRDADKDTTTKQS